jgi:hypothetical protein
MIRGCGARSDRDTRRLQTPGAAANSAGTIGRIQQRPNPSRFGRIIRQIEDLAAPAHPPHKIRFQAAPDDAAAPRPAPRAVARLRVAATEMAAQRGGHFDALGFDRPRRIGGGDATQGLSETGWRRPAFPGGRR